MKWTSQWMHYRGTVRMVADDQTVHKGKVRVTAWLSDLPVMLIECEDKTIRSVHPAHVWPIQEVK